MSQPTDALPPPWHAMAAEDVTRRLEVDPGAGLSSAEAARRLQRYGPNRLAQATREPRWRVFVRQFQSPAAGHGRPGRVTASAAAAQP